MLSLLLTMQHECLFGELPTPCSVYRIGRDTTTKSLSGILIYLLVLKITVVFQRTLLQATLPNTLAQIMK